jgi:hypothetical protein
MNNRRQRREYHLINPKVNNLLLKYTKILDIELV